MSDLQEAKPAKLSTLGVRRQVDLIYYHGLINQPFAPGEVFGPLVRDYYVIRYCVKGKGEVVINENRFSIMPGQCYVAFPGVVMVETADETDPWVLSWATIDGIKAGMILKNIGITPDAPLFRWKENPQVLQRLEEMAVSCTERTSSTELRRIAHAYLLFDELKSFYSTEEVLRDEYVSEAIQYMEINCCSKIKIMDIAAHIGLNRSYLFSLFKRHTGLSPQEYLTRMRIHKACDLFSLSHSSVENVANALGYEHSVFFRHFRRIVGVTPSEYLRKLSDKHIQSEPGDTD